MILTPKELKHFVNFKIDEDVSRDENYSTEHYDIFHLTYSKEYINIWGKPKEKIWKRVIEFHREGYVTPKMSGEAKELAGQLREVVSKQWKKVSKDNYDFFLDTHPERFV